MQTIALLQPLPAGLYLSGSVGEQYFNPETDTTTSYVNFQLDPVPTIHKAAASDRHFAYFIGGVLVNSSKPLGDVYSIRLDGRGRQKLPTLHIARYQHAAAMFSCLGIASNAK